MYKLLVIVWIVCQVVPAVSQEWRPLANKKYIILSEQAKSRVGIADVDAQKIVWEWCPAEQPDIPKEHADWFSNMSDAKLVKSGEYLLACASGGGVALVRMADKKTVFYAYAGGNTHSIELLPDGNIVSASSTGNLMRMFVYDASKFPDQLLYKDYYLYDGHNLVWDTARKLLYSASNDQLFSYRYHAADTALVLVDSAAMPDGHAHDLYWEYKKKFLWLSSGTAVFRVYVPSGKTERVNAPVVSNIKSVSSGPPGYPVIVIKPKERWWTDEVTDIYGKTVFKQPGLRIYKARWLLQ